MGEKSEKSGLTCECKVCIREYREINKEKLTNGKIRYYSKEENKKRKSLTDRMYRQKNKEKIAIVKANGRYLKLYGLSLNDKEKMRLEQDNRCAICTDEFKNNNIDCHIDHDHKTGKVRALLCHQCNRWLAILEDDVFTKSAYLYLEKYSGSIVHT